MSSDYIISIKAYKKNQTTFYANVYNAKADNEKLIERSLMISASHLPIISNDETLPGSSNKGLTYLVTIFF